MSLCESLDASSISVIGTLKCWIKDFKSYRLAQSETWPVPQGQLAAAVQPWLF